MQFLSLSKKKKKKGTGKKKNLSENSNLAPFILIKMMLNELFPVFDNTPHVCESMFTFVQEIKLILHYRTLKGSFYNFIWNENMISHRFSNQETFRIHLVQPQFTHPFPFQTEIFYLFLFSRHSWTCWKEKWTKIKNIIKWLIYEGLQLSVLRRWRISKILKHMNNDNHESSASWCILKSISFWLVFF